MVINPRKYEFMSFGKTNGNGELTYHRIRLKKTPSKKLLEITIDMHLDFNEHRTHIYKSAHLAVTEKGFNKL